MAAPQSGLRLAGRKAPTEAERREALAGFPPLSDSQMNELNERHKRRHESPSAQKARAKAENEHENEFERMERQEREGRRSDRHQSLDEGLDTARRAAGASTSLLQGKRPSSGGPGGTLAGVLLGLAATALFVNLLEGGPAQAVGWLKAKFINEPYLGPGATAKPSGPSKPSPPSTSSQVAA